jgi:hypothetical protein
MSSSIVTFITIETRTKRGQIAIPVSSIEAIEQRGGGVMLWVKDDSNYDSNYILAMTFEQAVEIWRKALEGTDE